MTQEPTEDHWLDELAAIVKTLDEFFGEGMSREDILQWAAAQDLAFVVRGVVFYLRAKDIVAGRKLKPAILKIPEPTLEECLDKLRKNGWMVAVHNDYRKEANIPEDNRIYGPGKTTTNRQETKQIYTFWLFTHPESGTFIKGEGKTDIEAVGQVIKQIEE